MFDVIDSLESGTRSSIGKAEARRAILLDLCLKSSWERPFYIWTFFSLSFFFVFFCPFFLLPIEKFWMFQRSCRQRRPHLPYQRRDGGMESEWNSPSGKRQLHHLRNCADCSESSFLSNRRYLAEAWKLEMQRIYLFRRLDVRQKL